MKGKQNMSLRNIAIAFIILFLGFVFVCADYCWTKSSLEDISGKEVSPETVIWTMMKTGGSK